MYLYLSISEREVSLVMIVQDSNLTGQGGKINILGG